MAKNTTSQVENTAPVDGAPAEELKVKRKKRFRKELKLHTPYVKWYVGLVVCGTITRKFENRGTFGVKENVEIKLLEPCTFTTSDGEVITLDSGETIMVGKVAALGAVMSLPVETMVEIECTGQKDMGKGKEPAWDFEVGFE